MSNNKYYYYFGVFSFFSVLFFSCEKSEIPIYEQCAGLFFSSSKYSYSFVEDPDQTNKILKLQVDITGDTTAYDREFTVATPKNDTVTTAQPDQYKIGKGIVKAGEFSGYVEVEVFRDDRIKMEVAKVSLEIQPSEVFPETKLNASNIEVSFTAMIMKPANWDKYLKYYFGVEYSDSWWAFILKATGRTSLPCWPTGAKTDPDTWWMSTSELSNLHALVKIAFLKYNAEHSVPLKHEDGIYKNTIINLPMNP